MLRLSMGFGGAYSSSLPANSAVASFHHAALSHHGGRTRGRKSRGTRTRGKGSTRIRRRGCTAPTRRHFQLSISQNRCCQFLSRFLSSSEPSSSSNRHAPCRHYGDSRLSSSPRRGQPARKRRGGAKASGLLVGRRGGGPRNDRIGLYYVHAGCQDVRLQFIPLLLVQQLRQPGRMLHDVATARRRRIREEGASKLAYVSSRRLPFASVPVY